MQMMYLSIHPIHKTSLAVTYDWDGTYSNKKNIINDTLPLLLKIIVCD